MKLELDAMIKLLDSRMSKAYEMADALHTDEGIYLEEETRWREKAEIAEQFADALKDYKRLLSADAKIKEARDKLLRLRHEVGYIRKKDIEDAFKEILE